MLWTGRRTGDTRPSRAAPIAAGTVSPEAALIGAAGLGGTALGVAFWLGRPFGLVALAFVGLLVLYNQLLKHMVILDVFTIAAGFVLRAVAGVVVVAVPISQWLLVCTMLLALFLGLAKRRHELELLGDEAAGHRRAFAEYSPRLLDQLISIVAAATVVSYALYTVEPVTVEKFGTDSPHADGAVSRVRRLSLPLSHPPAGWGREPGRVASPRPTAARMRDALGNSYSTHYL